MDYKYKRGQIFGKRLKVPKNILAGVYNCTLSFSEFMEYELEDKIPITCLAIEDRQIVQKFGIEKAKTFDWELLDKYVFYTNVNFKTFLMQCSETDEDINEKLNEIASDNLRPIDYSKRLQALYPDRMIFSIDDYPPNQRNVIKRFNKGEVSLVEIIRNWELFKDNDLSICLKNDSYNVIGITSSELKTFMSTFQNFVHLILETGPIYSLIQEFNSLSGQERLEYIKKITDSVLEKTIRIDRYHSVLELSNEEYKQLFQYSSMQEYFKKASPYSDYYIDKIFEELGELPHDYIFDIPIPFNVLKNSDVLSFIGIYGLKNTVDFDNECGHFFTKDECNMLKLMYEMYMHYGGNEHDPNKYIYTRNPYDENGNYVDRLYTKDEFYEAIKRMVIYGPSNWDYASKAPDYRSMTGEFRVRNASLFISEQAPEELQKEFYTKNITPHLLVEHPDYIPYLEGKDLSSCFRKRDVYVEGSNSLYGYENFYNFLGEKLSFHEVMDFITEYSDVFDIVFDRSISEIYLYEIRLSKEDTIQEIKKKVHTTFKKFIVEKGIIYPKNIPQNLKDQYPSMFLSIDAPKELQEAFYNRTITNDFILSNPVYRKYLRKVDLELLYKYMPVKVSRNGNVNSYINLTTAIEQVFGSEDSFDIMLQYGKYIETVFEQNRLCEFQLHPESSKDEVLKELDSVILKVILEGVMKYDENMPNHFKSANPTLFLDSSLPQDMRDKFYDRKFTIDDFSSNPSLLDLFADTNIVCGFPMNLSWMIPLFNDLKDLKEANHNRLKLMEAYYKIKDIPLQSVFRECVMEFENNLNMEKIECLSEVLERLSYSNSSEIFAFRKELAVQLLKTENPLESLDKVEEIFIKNNIPIVGKIYSCFEILHPDFRGFLFDDNSMVSPVLQSSSTMRKKTIVFADLIKASFGSNNKSVLSYLNNIEIGSSLYDSIKNGSRKYDALTEEERQELATFSKHLSTLYNNTLKGKKDDNQFQVSGDVILDIQKLSILLSPNGNLDYNLADRVIRMFCGFAGINSLEQAKYYIHTKVDTANSRNRESAKNDMTLEQGDFIKGIGSIKYLHNILQNGSVSKEFLGSSAGSDLTPLDTDISMILSDGTIWEKMARTAASKYGPIWFVLKNDGRFNITRTKEETVEQSKDISKMETFYTGVLGSDHYGIRTGFASSEINYIVMEDYDRRVGLEIAMNGFYIPVVDKEGKIVFTPNDYDKIREKMSGLTYFGEDSYHFSDHLVTEETEYFASKIEENNYEVQGKRTQINEMIRSSLEELGLQLKTTLDGDLTEGFVEIIDTGSTGRGTNKPGDGDFDFMMRLDKIILLNPTKLNELKQTLLRRLGKENSFEITDSGDFRLKNVLLPSSIAVDIDITFTEKTDKVSYSTDMSIQDRLSTIQKTDSEKYKYVVANILLAKRVLKEAGAYKPNRGEVPQGGLGGVGIENWILQNGGSFIDAATSFVESAEGKTFQEFQDSYQVWDFGDNHLAEKRGKYSHDNFVANNMSEVGYQKMVQALKEYLKTAQLSQIESIHK